MARATAWLACIAALVLPRPAFAQPGPTREPFGGSGIVSAATSGASSGLDRRDISLSGSKLILPVIASAERFAYGKLHTVLEIANITEPAADFDLHADNDRPRGATVANTTVYMLDSDDDKVYAYPAGASPGTTDSQPSFTTTVGCQSCQSGTAITPLTVLAASGGDGSLAYGLSPGAPGPSFNAATRVLAGTPTAAGTYNMTHTAAPATGVRLGHNGIRGANPESPFNTIDRAAFVPAAATFHESLTALEGIRRDNDSPHKARPFSIPDRGGESIKIGGTGETLRVGYGRIGVDEGSTAPSGIAILQFRDREGVLISEASVPATESVTAGRIFAEVDGPVSTGLAIANPNDVSATIRFYYTDSDGNRSSDGAFQLGAHEQIVRTLSQEPYNTDSAVLGTFTFVASVPVAVIAFRVFSNEADEFLMTELPVAPTSSTVSDPVYFPHFAAGAGWATEVVLVNPTDQTITGTLELLGRRGGTAVVSPVAMTLKDGRTGSSFDYMIPPGSARRFATADPSRPLTTGSVRATPNPESATPSGLVIFSYRPLVIFSYRPGDKTLSEAGVPALPKGSAFRVYVEESGVAGQVGSIWTGLAIANTEATANTVTLEATHLDGSMAGPAATLALPPSGQTARFLDELLTLPENFAGVVRVTSTDDVTVVGLRMRINAKGELKATTTPPSAEGADSTVVETHFPYLADSGGWHTQIILLSGTPGRSSSGTLRFTGASGQSLDLRPTRPLQEFMTIVPADPSLGPTEAGKQAQDPLVLTVTDESGTPVAGASFRWGSDQDSGWVYPPNGVTGADGRINAVWVAGWPGVNSKNLTVENAASELKVEVVTESVASRRPPKSAINLFMPSGAAGGYSIDLTPLAEPAGTYYAAIQWDGGYTGLQRAGSRYDRQLQFSVWDADGIDAQLIRRGEGVICGPFGGEGTGQKCELNYPWRAGDTYRFEVTERDLNGGSLMTLHVTDLASDQRTFVGSLRFGRRANLRWMNMFVEDFINNAPTCLAQPVRSAAIRRAMALVAGSWHPVTTGFLSPHTRDSGNPGTPPCANFSARDHESGLEVVMGGLTAGGPVTNRHVSIPGPDGSKATVPEVIRVWFPSRPQDGTAYGAGEQIRAQIEFSHPIEVTGSPTLALTVGTSTRQAHYFARSDSAAVFRYTVQAGDADADGISILADALALNGGSIRSAAGVDASLGLGIHAVANHPEHRVDGGG